MEYIEEKSWQILLRFNGEDEDNYISLEMRKKKTTEFDLEKQRTMNER